MNLRQIKRELKNKVGLRREKMKQEIDEEALKMIDKLNEYQKECKEMATAFNGKFLLDILTKCEDERVNIKLWSPNKAAIVNDKFLIMPLMLNE